MFYSEYTPEEIKDLAEIERNDDDRRQAESGLRVLWGLGYKDKMQAVSAFMETLPVAVQVLLAQSKTPSGSKLGNNANIVEWLSQVADSSQQKQQETK